LGTELRRWPAQGLKLIVLRYKHGHRHRKRTEILLVLEVLIRRDEDVKVRGGRDKQFTIRYSRPSSLDHDDNLVPGEQLPQPTEK